MFKSPSSQARTKLAEFSTFCRGGVGEGTAVRAHREKPSLQCGVPHGSSYVPVTDEIVEELKAQSLLPVERFLDLLIDRVGYSSYLKEQIRTELKSSGDPVTQITVLQGAIPRPLSGC